jgi:hypothetical protein
MRRAGDSEWLAGLPERWTKPLPCEEGEQFWRLVRFDAEQEPDRLDYYAALEQAEHDRKQRERKQRARVLPPPSAGRLTLADALDRLGPVRRTRKGWSARCPAHEDRTPSLSVTESDLRPGEPVFHCFAGCHWTQIVESLR